ncbi:MAG TPA: hypothetical protein VFQ24_17575 [Terriglobia bacterium]|nr:hypothetical protein [Terriglobia bacterium]
MIGVIAKSADSEVVSEFFQLFKTPWEWYRDGGRYDVVLCAGDGVVPDGQAELVLIYGGSTLPFDAEQGIETVALGNHAGEVRFKDGRLPIYRDYITFKSGARFLVEQETGHPLVHISREGTRTVARIGYNLFEEARALLTVGQPVANASSPVLELHIGLLRDLIVSAGVPLAEIPPVPEGHRFIACLTHDIDHPSIRRHKFDHTLLGFLYRAVFVSLGKACRGHLPLRSLLRNWAAAAKLPFVYLGLAKDFWYEFDRYLRMEEGLPSTFFVIPYSCRPGRLEHGSAPKFRASQYGAADIAAKIRELTSAGCEIGVHGIDAWLDSSSGRTELEVVRGITGTQCTGSRMHWLYFGEGSPVVLEEAGIDYDSTIGYNATVGYRAGTTQAYKPLGAKRLLELPLHIMDTALFFPAHLNLSSAQASLRVGQIVDNAIQFGGVITVNWHDRSISPERCWDEFYVDLVRNLRSRGAWFATAANAVSWFRQRRLAVFEFDEDEPDVPRIRTEDGEAVDLPGLQLRVYNARKTQPGLCNS